MTETMRKVLLAVARKTGTLDFEALVAAVGAPRAEVAAAARRAADFGYLDSNRWDGYTLYPQGWAALK